MSKDSAKAAESFVFPYSSHRAVHFAAYIGNYTVLQLTSTNAEFFHIAFKAHTDLCTYK